MCEGSNIIPAVDIGGHFFPLSVVDEVVSKAFVPAVFKCKEVIEGVGEEFTYSARGTAIAIKLESLYLLIHTDHQLSGFVKSVDNLEMHSVCLPGKVVREMRSPMKSFLLRRDRYDSLPDIAFHDFSHLVRSEFLEERYWLDISRESRRSHEGFHLFSFAVGLPTDLATLDYETGYRESTPYSVLVEPCVSQLSGLYSVRPSSRMSVDPDGLSGGGVFEVVLVEYQIRLNFLGLISNASRMMINYIPLEAILEIFIAVDILRNFGKSWCDADV